jgi:hypothetical protein
VDQNTLSCSQCTIDKVVAGIEDTILLVKDNLGFMIQPVVGQISDANGLPVVRHLTPCGIDDMSDFIGHNELQVLGGEFVPDEQAIHNLDCSKSLNIHFCALEKQGNYRATCKGKCVNVNYSTLGSEV